MGNAVDKPEAAADADADEYHVDDSAAADGVDDNADEGQGVDGKWSSLDSRVAMKFHTVVNAEGELAARTDSRWISALAAHGYTLDDDGEIAQLTHVVRPLGGTRRSWLRSRRTPLAKSWRTRCGAAYPSRRSRTLGAPHKSISAGPHGG